MKLLLAMFLSCFIAGNVTAQNKTQEDQFKLLSYNVQHCMGQDGLINYDRIASIITQVNPDVVCLQEIDSVNGRCEDIDQMKVLGEKTKMHHFFSASIPFMGGKYGIGILSKKEPISVKRINLPGEEPRSALAVEFDSYVVIGTHLDLEEANRASSVQLLTDLALSYNKKVFLAGDFNETDLKGGFFSEMLKNWKLASTQQKTYPTGNPVELLDLIFTLNGYSYQLIQSEAIYTLPNVDVSNASDHYPIYSLFKK